MTRTLILTRHAKSSWNTPGLDDFDRPLNRRGREAARAIGQWLRETGHNPEEVILSGARRTVETWEGIAPALPAEITTRSDPALYHASAASMAAVLKTARAANVMMIGHNPGIGAFAQRLVTAAPDHPRFDAYPTCATTVMEFPADDWRGIDWGQGKVLAFIVPRDLT